MNKIIKKIVSGTVLCTMIMYTMPILAYTNEETIYSKLNASGDVYQNIVSTITEDDEGTKTVQENTDKELPVDCKVTYTLDGKEMSPEEIAGKSGKIKITLEYTNKVENEVNINGKTEVMYTPFLVVSGLIIENENNKDIQITNGKLINNGDKTIAVGFALPGMQENLDLEDIDIPNTIEITMNATNFEMGNIMSFATPKILEEGSLDNIYDELDEIYSQVDTLEEASKELEDGTITLRDGIITLNDGTKTLNNGAQSLNGGAQTLNNGAKTLNDGAQALNSGAEDLKNGIDTLKAGSSQVNAGANSLKNGTAEYSANSNLLNQNMQQFSTGANDLNTQYANLDGGIKALKEKAPALAQGATDIKNALSSQVLGSLNQVNAGLENVVNAIQTTQTVDTTTTGNTEASTAIGNAISTLNSTSTSATQSIDLTNQKNNIVSQKQQLQAILDSDNLDDNSKAIIGNAINILAQSEETLNSVPQSVTASVDLSGVKADIESAKTAVDGIQTQTTNTVTVNGNPSLEALVQSYEGIASAIDTQIIPGVTSLEAGAKEAVGGINQISDGSDAVKGGIATLSASASQLSDANSKLNKAAQTISVGANDLSNGVVSLDDGVGKLVEGSTTLANGTASLAEGSQTLANGTQTLVNGTNELANGTNSLSIGADTLLDGGNKLVEGVKKFNNEGIQKICDMVNVDVRKTENKLRTMENLSNEYQRFASDMSRDDIKFISILDSIKPSKKEEN